MSIWHVDAETKMNFWFNVHAFILEMTSLRSSEKKKKKIDQIAAKPNIQNALQPSNAGLIAART